MDLTLQDLRRIESLEAWDGVTAEEKAEVIRLARLRWYYVNWMNWRAATNKDGLKPIDCYAVFTDGKDLVVLGNPDEKLGEMSHSCDAMGCSSVDHVILTGKVTSIGL